MATGPAHSVSLRTNVSARRCARNGSPRCSVSSASAIPPGVAPFRGGSAWLATPERPSIMDTPQAQLVIGAGALLATAGAALFFAKRGRSDPERPAGQRRAQVDAARPAQGREGRADRAQRDDQPAAPGSLCAVARLQPLPRVHGQCPVGREDRRTPVRGGRSRRPAGQTVELLTEITHDVPGERIAWRSVEGSQITTAGEALFRDARARARDDRPAGDDL